MSASKVAADEGEIPACPVRMRRAISKAMGADVEEIVHRNDGRAGVPIITQNLPT